MHGMNIVMPIVAVKEIEPVLDFWTEQLGFTANVVVRDEESGKVVHAGAQFGDAPMMISLAGDDNVAASAGIGLVLYLYTDDDIDAYYERVRGQPGVTVTQEIADQYWGDRCFTIEDPFGFTWQFGKHTGAQAEALEGTTLELAGVPV